MNRARSIGLTTLLAVVLGGCASSAAPAPTDAPATPVADGASPSPEVAREAMTVASTGDTFCVQMVGSDPTCGSQKVADGSTVVTGEVITTDTDTTRQAAGGPRRICLQTREHILALQLQIAGVGDSPTAIDVSPVCLTGAGGELFGMTRVMGDVVLQGDPGSCGSCWAFSATDKGVRFIVGGGSGAAKTTEVPWGATEVPIVIGGVELAVAAALAPDGTATVTWSPS